MGLFRTNKSNGIIRDIYDALNDWYSNSNLSLSDVSEKYKLKTELIQVIQQMNIGKKSGHKVVCILNSPPSFDMADNLYNETKKFINDRNKNKKQPKITKIVNLLSN